MYGISHSSSSPDRWAPKPKTPYISRSGYGEQLFAEVCPTRMMDASENHLRTEMAADKSDACWNFMFGQTNSCATVRGSEKAANSWAHFLCGHCVSARLSIWEERVSAPLSRTNLDGKPVGLTREMRTGPVLKVAESRSLLPAVHFIGQHGVQGEPATGFICFSLRKHCPANFLCLTEIGTN